MVSMAQRAQVQPHCAHAARWAQIRFAASDKADRSVAKAHKWLEQAVLAYYAIRWDVFAAQASLHPQSLADPL